jgi:hypothetical protein
MNVLNHCENSQHSAAPGSSGQLAVSSVAKHPICEVKNAVAQTAISQ